MTVLERFHIGLTNLRDGAEHSLRVAVLSDHERAAIRRACYDEVAHLLARCEAEAERRHNTDTRGGA